MLLAAMLSGRKVLLTSESAMVMPTPAALSINGA
jgi:hypothetical protein